MKRILFIIMTVVLGLMVTACGDTNATGYLHYVVLDNYEAQNDNQDVNIYWDYEDREGNSSEDGDLYVSYIVYELSSSEYEKSTEAVKEQAQDRLVNVSHKNKDLKVGVSYFSYNEKACEYMLSTSFEIGGHYGSISVSVMDDDIQEHYEYDSARALEVTEEVLNSMSVEE